ncbi:MAG: hypothetical protein IIY21_07630 [Clostridiales bacterium]|nr:hypothetical protein [Clostridiales bacterium]
MTEKMILDVTCGDRTIWFQKNEPHTLYCDIRREEWEGDFGKTLRADGKKKHRHIVIDPDIQCSFTDLPFKDNTFSLIVFDPPHIENLSENAWMRKAYGSLDGDWKPMIRKGFKECMRVLRVGGVLIFKWSDISVSTREIINIIGQEPLFGHRSGKKMNTHWMAYMKFDTEADRKTENSSEKPNNCEHITEDGVTCAKYPACDDCLDNPLNKVKGSERLLKGKDEPTISKMEQVDKDINVRSKDEPQMERSE